VKAADTRNRRFHPRTNSAARQAEKFFDMNPEEADRQLLFCLSERNDEAKAGVMGQWQASDWDELLRQSVRHGLTPYVYHRLKAIRPAPLIPEPVGRKLREITYYCASRNMRLFHDLEVVLRTLHEGGIPVIVLKGAYLAEAVYDNISLRQMSDLDIMVKKSDLEGAASHVRSLGYSQSSDFWSESYLRVRRHLAPFYKHGSAPIEIHWTIISPEEPFDVNPDRLWRNARAVTIAGVETLGLSLEDMLLHLCVNNLYQDRFLAGLKGCNDISVTVKRFQNEIDWEKLRVHAREWKAEKAVYIMMVLVRDLYGVYMPDSVLKALKPLSPVSMPAVWAREQIFYNRDFAPGMRTNLVRVWKTRSIRDKATIILKSLFPSLRFMAGRYPVSPDSKRIYLYYPVRLMHLFRRWGGAAWHLLVREKKTMTVLERENRGNALEQWLRSTD
jgi:hypothetical protein